MPHRSFPPSHFNPPAISAATLLGMMRPVRGSENPKPPLDSRVRVMPSADGTVLIIGLTSAGKWVAEYRCLACDFDERAVRAMERKVREKELAALKLVK